MDGNGEEHAGPPKKRVKTAIGFIGHPGNDQAQEYRYRVCRKGEFAKFDWISRANVKAKNKVDPQWYVCEMCGISKKQVLHESMLYMECMQALRFTSLPRALGGLQRAQWKRMYLHKVQQGEPLMVTKIRSEYLELEVDPGNSIGLYKIQIPIKELSVRMRIHTEFESTPECAECGPESLERVD